MLLVGQLARQTGVSTRMLRYYEERGLIDATRADNGYRHYSADTVNRVDRIRTMLSSSIPTAAIRRCLPPVHTPPTTP